MKDAIQALLVDPIADSREQIQRLFEGMTTVWLSEVCTEYGGAARRVAAVQPKLVVIDIDADPVQAVSLIQTITQNNPDVVVLPASRVRDSSIILRVIRAGAREFLTLPSRARGGARGHQPPAQPPRRRPGGPAGRKGAAGHRHHRRGGGDRLHDAGRQPRHHAGQDLGAGGRARRLRPDARVDRRLPRHHPRPDPPGGRPEHRPARPDAPEAVDDPALVGALRPAPPGR